MTKMTVLGKSGRVVGLEDRTRLCVQGSSHGGHGAEKRKEGDGFLSLLT